MGFLFCFGVFFGRGGGGYQLDFVRIVLGFGWVFFAGKLARFS